VVGLGTEVGAAVASGTEVASIAGGEVASATRGVAVGSGAGAEVGVGGAAAPQATIKTVISINKPGIQVLRLISVGKLVFIMLPPRQVVTKTRLYMGDFVMLI
jgi:hypothetical protein